jgi:hypothetical protein
VSVRRGSSLPHGAQAETEITPCPDPKRGTRSAAPARREVPRWATLLLVVVAGFSLLRAWEYAEPSAGMDFYQFWLAGQELASSESPRLYQIEGHQSLGVESVRRARRSPEDSRTRRASDYWGTNLLLTGSPLLYSFFGLTGSGEYDRDLSRYKIFSLIAGAGSCLVLCHLFGYSRVRSLVAVILVLLVYEPFYSDMRVANVNRLQLLVLSLFLWNQSRSASTARDLVGGFLLGFLVFFKPNLVIAVGAAGLCWLFDRKLRTLRDQLLGSALFVILAGGVSVGMFGRIGVWRDWYRYVGTLQQGRISVEMGNLAPAAVLTELFDVKPALLLTLAVVAATGAALFFTRIRDRESVRPALRPGSLVDDLGRMDRAAVAMAAGCLAFLLGAKLAWIHYYTAMLPAILIALRPLPKGALRAWHRGLTLLALAPLVKSPPTLFMLDAYPRTSAAGYAMATAILFGLLLRELRQSGVSTARA